MSCCDIKKKHLIIIGGGSAAFAAAIKASSFQISVTIINHHLPIGGTCVNVGCVPSKALIRAAEAHHQPSHHHFEGIEGQSKITNFKKIMDENRKLVSNLRNEKYMKQLDYLTPKGCQYKEGIAKLLNENQVEINGEVLEADKIIIASGSTPFIPPIKGLSDCKFYTNENIFDMNQLPASIIVIGGGYVALECAQMLSRFGSKVTILQRSHRILSNESPLVSEAITNFLREEGIDIRTNVNFLSCDSFEKDRVTVSVIVDGKNLSLSADTLLVAAGRVGNSKYLGNLLKIDSSGFVKVNENLQTNISNIFAAGDIIGESLYVYTAAYEGSLAAENAFSKNPKARDYYPLPWTIFTDPQVCGVGMDKEQAEKCGIKVDVVVLSISDIPRSIAARDTRGFIQLIRERETLKILGARIVAHEGSELLGELTLAIKLGVTSKQLASMFHTYLTLGEGIKLAALMFDTDIAKLSCCASNL
jgi:mercuric reductase